MSADTASRIAAFTNLDNLIRRQHELFDLRMQALEQACPEHTARTHPGTDRRPYCDHCHRDAAGTPVR